MSNPSDSPNTTARADTPIDPAVELKHIRHLVSAVDDVLIVNDANGVIKWTNARASELHREPEGGWIGTTLLEHVADDASKLRFINLARARDNPDHRAEAQLTCFDRNGDLIEVWTRVVYDPGSDLFYSIERDITERDAMEKDLRATQQRYAVAFEASRDGVWEFNLADQTFIANERNYELLNQPFEPDPVSAERLREVIGISEYSKVEGAMREIVYTGTGVTLDFEVHGATGVRTIETSALPIIDDDGTITSVVGFMTDVTEAMQRSAALEFAANHDALTGLKNRRFLISALNRMLAASQACTLLSVDLDDFKIINDSLGHEAGDEMLEVVARRLVEIAGQHHIVARFGGDEFAILMDTDDLELAQSLGHALLDAWERPFYIANHELYGSMSVGIVAGRGTHNDANELLRDADIALYAAKAKGKSTVAVFKSPMRAEAEIVHQMHNDIRRAVSNNVFELYYQPILDTATMTMTSCEALIRWNRSGVPVAPSEFLPYIEQTGLIAKVGRWVIDKACEQLAQWRRDFPHMAHISVAVNISRAQFDRGNLLSDILHALVKNGLTAADLTVEITETAVAGAPEDLLTTVQQLRSAGIAVAMDDFGIGQSSLADLYELPFDTVKIDKSFISRIRPDAVEPVIDAALSIVRAAGIKSVAEGVETAAQLEWLVARGCTLVQGYYLARPVPADQLPELAVSLQPQDLR